MTLEKPRPPSPIAVGVAGWSYPDWEGIVYAGGVPDKLAFLARHVDVIEINSSFYRPPTREMATSWLERTADLPAFFFTAKLHRDITHRGALEDSTVNALHEAFRPMADAGRLRHLLAQFHHAFCDTPAGRKRLAAIRDRFAPLANLVLELRHNSWQGPAALAFLEQLGVTVANLDYPTTRDSFTLAECRVGEHAYVRLHGRNRSAWFDPASGRDQTYDYDYSRSELDAIVRRVLSVGRTARTVTLIANNHFRGQEVANALELKWLLTGQKVPVPGGLLAAFPRLQEIAR